MIREYAIQFHNGARWLHAATIYAESANAARKMFYAEPNNPYAGRTIRVRKVYPCPKGI